MSAVGLWQNVYTNSVTAENLYGSINFVDTEAKGKSAFYRVVSLNEAAKAAPAGIAPQPASALEKKIWH